jgi:hypothetical protein
MGIDEIRETGHCRACGHTVRFGTNDIGMAWEACNNPDCYFKRPHAIRPDLSLMKGPDHNERVAERRRLERAAKRMQS